MRKESGKVGGGPLMECVASTELSVGVKVNFNTTYYILMSFLYVSTWFYFSIMILLCAALLYAI